MEELLSFLIYTFVFCIPPIIIYCIKRMPIERNLCNTIILISILLPCLLATFRYHIGTDYDSYYKIFTLVKTYDWHSILSIINYPKEPLFKLVIKLFSFLSNYAIFGIFAILTILPIIFTLKHYNNGFVFSLASFFYLYWYFPDSFNILRQALACSIVFSAIHALINGKRRNFLILVLIASLFHITSLISILILFIWNPNKKEAISDSIFYPLLILLSFFLLYWNNLFSIINISLYNSYATRATSGTNASTLLKLTITVIFMIHRHKLIQRNKINDLFVKLQTISTVISLIAFQFPYITRLSLYFEYTNIVLFAQLPLLYKDFQKFIITILIILLCNIYFFGIQCKCFSIYSDSSYFPLIFIPKLEFLN